MRNHGGRRPAPEPIETAFALPIGFTGLLAIGTLAAVVARPDRAVLVGVLTCLLITALVALSRPGAALPLAVLGWFTVFGFSWAPVGTLTGAPIPSVAAVAGATGVGLGAARLRRRERTLGAVPLLHRVDRRNRRLRKRRLRPTGVSARRRLAGFLLGAALLPALTAAMTEVGHQFALVDELLFYLLAVIAVTLVGGFWPAVVAALAAGVLVNWYFTPPVHTWTIEDPQNLLALLLFVTTAVSVSTVVHLAARRDEVARERTAEAEALLALARTVLGDDTPQAVLAHLHATTGLEAVLEERVAGRWISVTGAHRSGSPTRVSAGELFRLAVYGDARHISPRLLAGVAVQAASACERQRLRVQAEQNEALAAANRMRTALLAAVSHDLRTPLASVKAAVSSLRQRDVTWSRADREDLLATVEEGADRLDSLIGNLLDMSRIHTGAVQPFLRSVSLDEILPAVVRSVDATAQIDLTVPDDLPLLDTDPVLLERALANVLSNALRYSPASRPPEVVAAMTPDGTALRVEVVDHGPGVPVAQREQVFEPFQQLGDQRIGSGVGLGLAVAKGFVDAVGGHIAADATPGGGLTMRVELPVTRTATREDVPA